MEGTIEPSFYSKHLEKSLQVSKLPEQGKNLLNFENVTAAFKWKKQRKDDGFSNLKEPFFQNDITKMGAFPIWRRVPKSWKFGGRFFGLRNTLWAITGQFFWGTKNWPMKFSNCQPVGVSPKGRNILRPKSTQSNTIW